MDVVYFQTHIVVGHSEFLCWSLPFLLQSQFLHNQLNVGLDAYHRAVELENLSGQSVMLRETLVHCNEIHFLNVCI